MSNIQPMTEFKEKVTEKLKKDIGELLPESLLTEMVQQTINDQFFAKEKVNEGTSYHPRWVDRPGWFEKQVADRVRPHLEKRVNECIENNKARIDKMVGEFCSHERIALILVNGLAKELSSQLSMDLNNIVSNLALANQEGRY